MTTPETRADLDREFLKRHNLKQAEQARQLARVLCNADTETQQHIAFLLEYPAGAMICGAYALEEITQDYLRAARRFAEQSAGGADSSPNCADQITPGALDLDQTSGDAIGAGG